MSYWAICVLRVTSNCYGHMLRRSTTLDKQIVTETDTALYRGCCAMSHSPFENSGRYELHLSARAESRERISRNESGKRWRLKKYKGSQR
jgi:hypothetical protein